MMNKEPATIAAWGLKSRDVYPANSEHAEMRVKGGMDLQKLIRKSLAKEHLARSFRQSFESSE